jgi:large subunit ribosomal protein L30
MIAIIRISGLVKMNKKLEETMSRLRLRKKYTCVVIPEKPELLGMVQDLRNLTAFGTIDEKTLVELIKARAKKIGKKNEKVADADKKAKEILSGKTFEELGIKPWFGLHPARGGIDSKHHYPKGVLGDHKNDINKLIMRML